MCHALPVLIKSRDEDRGIGERDGLEIDLDLSLLPEALPGDLVIVHVGIALAKINSEDAEQISDLMTEPKHVDT